MKKALSILIVALLILSAFVSCKNDVAGFTVTFDANGGKGTMATQTITGSSGKLNANEFTRDGYVFTKWNTAADGSGTTYFDKSVVSSSQDIKLYAQWSVNSYTVTFDSQGGSEPDPKTVTVTYDSAYGELPATAMEGHEFLGWFTEKKGGTKVEATTVVKIASDHTLYAHWSANTYQVTFDAQGGSAAGPITVTYGAAYGTLPETTWAEHNLLGWFMAKTGGVKVEPTTIVTTAADHTLYAHWDVQTYAIKYVLDGGTINSGEVDSYTYGVGATLPTDVTKDGYNFCGFYNNPQFSGEPVTGVSKTDAGDKTFYAKWYQPTVTFDSNGGSGTMSAQSVKYDIDTALTANAFTRDGYGFNGWNTKEDGSGDAYADGGNIKIKTDAVLYAQWYQPTVTFHKNDGSTATSTQSVLYNKATALTANSFTWSGYVFLNWNTKADGTGTAYADKEAVTLTGNLDLYAQWAIDLATTTKYQTDWNEKNGKLYSFSDNITIKGRITVTGSVTLVLPEGKKLISKKGITVVGANSLTIDGTGTLVVNDADYYDAGIGGCIDQTAGTTIINGGEIRVYGGKSGSGIGGGYGGAGGTIIINGGEVDATGGEGGAGIGGGSGGAGGNVTINGGTVYGTGNSGVSGFGVGIGAGSGSTKQGTLVIGDGLGLYGGAKEGSEAFLSAPTDKYDGYHPVYMLTKATEYVSVTFKANGGTGEDKTQAIPISIDAKLAKNTFTRDTFSFVGWAETAEGEVVYEDQGTVNISADTTFYAKWTKENEPLTLEFGSTAGKVILSNGKEKTTTLKYAINGDVVLKNIVVEDEPVEIEVPSNGKISLYSARYEQDDLNIDCTADCRVSGNIMSLIYGENFRTHEDKRTIKFDHAFHKLFFENEHISIDLTNELVLPATTLAANCYQAMFWGCKELTAVPEKFLPATELAESCYNGMFSGCKGLTDAPVLPAAILAASCYQYMFFGCTTLNSITCLATDISASNCTNSWVYGVAGTGTFTKDPSMTSWTTGRDGIPDGWTVKAEQ